MFFYLFKRKFWRFTTNMTILQYLKLRFKWKFVLLGVLCVFFMDFMGLFTHLVEQDFASSFRYPYEGDVKTFVDQLRKGETPAVAPINLYNYRFISAAQEKCPSGETIRLVYLIKSAAANIQRRQAIRSSWGFERRFSDVSIRTVFVVGVVDDTDVLITVLHEREMYQDIVQVDFVDSYYNNTIKTMSAIKWAATHCPQADYYFFSDDDMYVSTKNVLRFVRNPVEYPKNLEAPIENNGVSNKQLHVYNVDLPPNVVFYAGYVFTSSPLRHKTSKWYVSLEEYPYDMWPPYVTAGSYMLSREALQIMYYTSMYTKHFRFDDIFLGLVALKAGIEPFHSDEFYFYHKPYSLHDYRYVIASHGFENPNVLVRVWNEQKTAGNA